jgi:antitoxin HicB
MTSVLSFPSHTRRKILQLQIPRYLGPSRRWPLWSQRGLPTLFLAFHYLLRYDEAVGYMWFIQMTTRDFKVFLDPDQDYGGYVVVCSSIPGCDSQGKTVPEALANIRDAIDLCLEDMDSRGEEIPDPNNVLIGSVLVTR